MQKEPKLESTEEDDEEDYEQDIENELDSVMGDVDTYTELGDDELDYMYNIGNEVSCLQCDPLAVIVLTRQRMPSAVSIVKLQELATRSVGVQTSCHTSLSTWKITACQFLKFLGIFLCDVYNIL